MSEAKDKKNALKLAVAAVVIPMFTLLLVWYDNNGLSPSWGSKFMMENEALCYSAVIVVILSLFSKIDWKYLLLLNAIGNLMLWVPIFYGAFDWVGALNRVTAICYISLSIVVICWGIQLRCIYKMKKVDRK